MAPCVTTPPGATPGLHAASAIGTKITIRPHVFSDTSSGYRWLPKFQLDDGAASGRSTKKDAPSPTWLRTPMVPPCASTITRAIQSPRPKPA